MNKLILFLKLLQKILPYLLTALGGSAATLAIEGCKCASVISFVK